jgi:multidrug efflux pump subunit AcrB
MNLVSLALRRPISLLMMVVSAALVGFLAVDRMSRDIFPDLGVPVLYVAQPYVGMDPAQMEGFIVNYYEYHFLYITGIEHVESKSIQGVGLIKLQFHPGTDGYARFDKSLNSFQHASEQRCLHYQILACFEPVNR